MHGHLNVKHYISFKKPKIVSTGKSILFKHLLPSHIYESMPDIITGRWANIWLPENKEHIFSLTSYKTVKN